MALTELDEWLAQWDGLDARGKPDSGAGAGVPPLIYGRMDQARRANLTRSVKQTRDEQVITITLPLQWRFIQCERKWVCRNGRWVQTDQCQATEEIGNDQDRKFELKGNALAPNQVDILFKQAVNAWTAAEAADEARKKAAEDCAKC